ncbi:MAG: VanW family protein [Eubacterium sp.]|nr:VanW family protein [Eubacterium sp.]
MNKSNKKALCSVLALVIILSALCACSNIKGVFKKEDTTVSTSETTTVTVPTSTTETTTENLKTTFREAYTQNVYPALEKDSSGKFSHKISEYSTYFNTGDVSRSSNIRHAAASINGLVIPSGGSFSFNQNVGKRTGPAGYDEAHVIRDGELVDGMGGGVCQVSTTIFEAVLRANVKILERHNHSLKVGYVPLGGDATVSFGSQDLKFRNTLGCDIKLSMKCSGGKLTCAVYSAKKVDVGNINISIKPDGAGGMDFVLTRSVNGKVNYSTKSHYDEQKTTAASTTKKR